MENSIYKRSFLRTIDRLWGKRKALSLNFKDGSFFRFIDFLPKTNKLSYDLLFNLECACEELCKNKIRSKKRFIENILYSSDDEIWKEIFNKKALLKPFRV